MNYSQLSRKLRLPLGFLLGGVYLVFARPNPKWLILGLSIAFVGLLIRGWAAGHIAKNQRLSVRGPYAYVRNPLYLGSFFLATGFALAWSWWYLLVVGLFFVFIYAPTIRLERDRMAELFPADFPEYEHNVPAFVPRVSPWRKSGAVGDGGGFTMQRYTGHAEWKAALGFALGVSWLLIRLNFGL